MTHSHRQSAAGRRYQALSILHEYFQVHRAPSRGLLTSVTHSGRFLQHLPTFRMDLFFPSRKRWLFCFWGTLSTPQSLFRLSLWVDCVLQKKGGKKNPIPRFKFLILLTYRHDALHIPFLFNRLKIPTHNPTNPFYFLLHPFRIFLNRFRPPCPPHLYHISFNPPSLPVLKFIPSELVFNYEAIGSGEVCFYMFFYDDVQVQNLGFGVEKNQEAQVVVR